MICPLLIWWSLFFLFSLTAGFPTAKTNQLPSILLLPNPGFPKANTATRSVSKCSSLLFGCVCFCCCAEPLSLTQQCLQSHGNIISISKLKCHLAQVEHNLPSFSEFSASAEGSITLHLMKRFWNVCLTGAARPKHSCLSLVSKPSLGSVFSRAGLSSHRQASQEYSPTTQDTWVLARSAPFHFHHL